MQLSNFLVIFALNLHNFCNSLPANSDKITDKSIKNEEIKEKSLENVISETVLWEHERNHTAEGPDYYIHKDDYFYGDEHEHKDNKTHGSHETHGSLEPHGHENQEENGSQQTKGSDKIPKTHESHGSHETHGSFEAHGHKHGEANGTIATPVDLEYESHETSGNYINVCGLSSSQAVIFKLKIFP
jgi:hypothetical protein